MRGGKWRSCGRVRPERACLTTRLLASPRDACHRIRTTKQRHSPLTVCKKAKTKDEDRQQDANEPVSEQHLAEAVLWVQTAVPDVVVDDATLVAPDQVAALSAVQLLDGHVATAAALARPLRETARFAACYGLLLWIIHKGQPAAVTTAAGASEGVTSALKHRQRTEGTRICWSQGRSDRKRTKCQRPRWRQRHHRMMRPRMIPTSRAASDAHSGKRRGKAGCAYAGTCFRSPNWDVGYQYLLLSGCPGQQHDLSHDLHPGCRSES